MENLLHNKLFDFAKEEKTSPFFLTDLCQIHFVQKTKRTFLKTSCCRLAYKKRFHCLAQLVLTKRKKTSDIVCLFFAFLILKKKQLCQTNQKSAVLFSKGKSCFFFLGKNRKVCCVTSFPKLFLFFFTDVQLWQCL